MKTIVFTLLTSIFFFYHKKITFFSLLNLYYFISVLNAIVIDLHLS